MGDKNIKKEAKKPKKSDKKSSVSAAPSSQKAVTIQPQLIKKEKKNI